MKIFFDAEFYENGKVIELISIGMVREDGESYYAETLNARNIADMTEWLRINVQPHLIGKEKDKLKIKSEIINFVGETPEFWAYYADYDWVVLCQLFGTMMDLPGSWPMFCMDIKQLAVMKGDPELPRQIGAEHSALSDAIWNKQAWEFLNSLPTQKFKR